jgi:hypothetical protein
MGRIRAALSPKEHEQDDDWDGNAEQPKESASTDTQWFVLRGCCANNSQTPCWFHRELDERLHSSVVKVLYQRGGGERLALSLQGEV